MSNIHQGAVEDPDLVNAARRRLPVGAEINPNGGVHFRVWAPKSLRVSIALEGQSKHIPLAAEGNGYHSGLVGEAAAGTKYKFILESGEFPDPVSRFQPEGPHGWSQVVDFNQFLWTDEHWKGAGKEGQVLYEMHIGTFTREGTWGAAARELAELSRLGVTLLEVMPVGDFPGRFGWGYDGVNLFAPTRLYGKPDDFRSFVNEAHAVGVGVILDVVYNHIGPDGNFLNEFSADYFTDKYKTDWGAALNFDGENCAPVREFFLSNAGYWMDEFHLDGLRLDATQSIFDSSPDHIIGQISDRVRASAKGKDTFIVAENEPQETRLVKPRDSGGFGADAVWNDDFHHAAVVTLTGRREAYYTDYFGSPQEFVSAAKYGFLYQGQRYQWQRARRGTASLRLHPASFVTFIQNHDQVANSLCGQRCHEVTGAGPLRAMTALLLLGPNTPMIFQGQEFSASSPFLYFADHNPELALLVAEGRREFLEQFPGIKCLDEDAKSILPGPHREETFERCKLDFADREKNRGIYTLYQDLLALRRSDPIFHSPRQGGVDGAVLGERSFVLRFFGEADDDRLLVVNFGTQAQVRPSPEPLLAPVEGCVWEMMWSSEHPSYGGAGTPPMDTDEGWVLPGHAAVVLKPAKAAQPEKSSGAGI